MNKPKRKKRLLLKILTVNKDDSSRLESSTSMVEPCTPKATSEVKPSTTSSEWRIVITHPTQSSFTCPGCKATYHLYASFTRHLRDRHRGQKVMWSFMCGMCYHLYASFTRHLRDRHRGQKVMWSFMCGMCEKRFNTKREVGIHVTSRHAGIEKEPELRKGTFVCQYCKETFSSSRSLSQHMRNKHAAAQSAKLADEASMKSPAGSQLQHWDRDTVEKFI